MSFFNPAALAVAKGMGAPQYSSADFDGIKAALSGAISGVSSITSSIARTVGVLQGYNVPDRTASIVLALQNAKADIDAAVAQAKNLIAQATPPPVLSSIPISDALTIQGKNIQAALENGIAAAREAIAMGQGFQPPPPPAPVQQQAAPVYTPPPPPSYSYSAPAAPAAPAGPDYSAMMAQFLAQQQALYQQPIYTPPSHTPPPAAPAPQQQYTPMPAPAPTYSVPAQSGPSQAEINQMIAAALAAQAQQYQAAQPYQPPADQTVYNATGAYNTTGYSVAPYDPSFDQSFEGRQGGEMFGMGADMSAVLGQIDAARAKIQGALAKVPALAPLVAGPQPVAQAPVQSSGGLGSMSTPVKVGLAAGAAFLGWKFLKRKKK